MRAALAALILLFVAIWTDAKTTAEFVDGSASDPMYIISYLDEKIVYTPVFSGSAYSGTTLMSFDLFVREDYLHINQKITLFNEEIVIPFSIETVIKGDINNNGAIGISDVVLLQKWILNSPDAKLNNWRAADLNNDEEINVYDLVLLRKKLLEVG